MTLYKIKESLDQRETEKLSKAAALSGSGVRRLNEPFIDTGYRQNFSVDVDRILHSLAYTRYIDKTQVFYLIENDHITHRMLHVQLVSKISRTIGRYLELNEDLIEAIALGHDIGHTPFGHDGENFLSKICKSYHIGHFLHSVQSIQFLDKVERKGKGWNLCLQTLDGILCHDGEIHNQSLEPSVNKTFKTLEAEIDEKKNNPATQLVPMTMEGCVVRMADTISYIGRDIEDAIRLSIIKRSDLPRESVEILGDTNGTIVYNLVSDIIMNSFKKAHLSFSTKISNALKRLKTFNMEYIYLNPEIKKKKGFIKESFKILFERYIEDLENENRTSVIFTGFLEDMSDGYIDSHNYAEIVRDFIAGMTDKYFLRHCSD
ncbi:dGTPase [Desulfosarcina sp. BuS5]|uniref:deoxyguanosinetriphosphate triphosphohydrolase family protein n=1 Tax=Desulfosarcina sp. BuS5 TaxID=933262 RepID=UPI000488B15C|nr:HD domain-containing protein [Desulfosarcina sp. BuS5]WDN89977.1 dGTPase [Desulfosarcina sp. BuS5]